MPVTQNFINFVTSNLGGSVVRDTIAADTDHFCRQRQQRAARRRRNRRNLMAIGAAAFALRFLVPTASIAAQAVRNQKIDLNGGIKLIISETIKSPVSWLRYIFMNRDDYNENSREILVHEMAHIRHRHSIDLMPGKVTNPTIVRSAGDALDEEAIRVVNALPDFTPGRQKGQPVAVSFVMPVKFAL